MNSIRMGLYFQSNKHAYLKKVLSKKIFRSSAAITLKREN